MWVLYAELLRACIGRHDLKEGVDQPLHNDLRHSFGVQDLGREVATAKQIGQNPAGVRFSTDRALKPVGGELATLA
jgi:hypothetical protein